MGNMTLWSVSMRAFEKSSSESGIPGRGCSSAGLAECWPRTVGSRVQSPAMYNQTCNSSTSKGEQEGKKKNRDLYYLIVPQNCPVKYTGPGLRTMDSSHVVAPELANIWSWVVLSHFSSSDLM